MQERRFCLFYMPTEGINPHELMKILLYGSQEHTDPQGVLPFISHIGMCRPKRYGFCAVLV